MTAGAQQFLFFALFLAVPLLAGIQVCRRHLLLLALAVSVAGCSAIESAWLHCDRDGRGVSEWQKRCEVLRRG